MFTVDLARKDAMTITKVAGADAHLVKVKRYMGERGGMASIYGVVRQEGGLIFEN